VVDRCMRMLVAKDVRICYPLREFDGMVGVKCVFDEATMEEVAVEQSKGSHRKAICSMSRQGYAIIRL
jgi:hypothetical protein